MAAPPLPYRSPTYAVGAEERRRGLDAIMEHYGEERPHLHRENDLSLTAVIRIDIEEMTGKANGY
ncbi:MAG: hypothetical protein QME88_10320 [Actinomycetota bacterium]|nr:hypothetical protein [Actinomycetota bacterium]